jgi:hypothetical protein
VLVATFLQRGRLITFLGLAAAISVQLFVIYVVQLGEHPTGFTGHFEWKWLPAVLMPEYVLAGWVIVSRTVHVARTPGRWLIVCVAMAVAGVLSGGWLVPATDYHAQYGIPNAVMPWALFS